MNEKRSRFWQLTDLLHWTTRDVRGQPVGHVVDVIIDASEGRIAYLRIQMNDPGTGPDIGITVPWSAISRISDSQRDIWIAARRDTLLRLGSGAAAH
jgi:sporulation protein YlmC with PRC-barrel domain